MSEEKGMRKQRQAAILLLLLSLSGASAAFFSGCAGKTVNESDPSSLYQDAEEDIKSDRYQIALEKLKDVKNKFPYSKYAVDAQLRIADIYFMQELFPEAAANYETFRDLHPKHEKVEYAIFRVAKSYFSDMPSTEARDLTPAFKAQDAYEDYLKRYPSSTYSAEAKKDLAAVRNLLAKKELYIGDFYYKRDFYESAKTRYQKILDTYGDTEIADEARKKLAKTNEELEKNKPADGSSQ